MMIIRPTAEDYRLERRERIDHYVIAALTGLCMAADERTTPGYLAEKAHRIAIAVEEERGHLIRKEKI